MDVAKPGHLVVRFPARPGYLAISRLNATALASTNGFNVDDLDDLRLAIDEAVTWLVGQTETEEPGLQHDGSVELTMTCEPGRLDIVGHHFSDRRLDAPEMDELVHAILGATVDSYDTGIDADGHRFISLVKQTVGDA